jgi:hypothetical protein
MVRGYEALAVSVEQAKFIETHGSTTTSKQRQIDVVLFFVHK